jgi:CubicO group peptidase (beta-lactamase class C family)
MTDHSKVKKWIEYIVPKYMQDFKIPGMSVAVVKEGETIYSEGFGARDPQRNLPATPDTLYGIGSITKSFVAIAIMQLEEQGLLRVDDPVSKYIPFKLGLPGKPIKIHHFLTHSSGLPSLATSSVALHRGIGIDKGIPWGNVEDFYRLVNTAQEEIAGEPGVRFFYHNAAWRMLGNIVQELSGQPFHVYIKKKILDPLGMTRSTLKTDDFNRDSNHIVPHWKKPDGTVEPSRFPYPNPEDNPDFSFIAAAGGITSSVNEMTRYLNVHINKGSYEGASIASPTSFEKIHSIYSKRTDNLYGKLMYGYGVGITPDFHGYKMISHGGSIIVSTAHMSIIPELKTGVVMMANSAAPPWGDIAEGIYCTLLGLEPFEALPSLRVKKKLRLLIGAYSTFKDIERVEVQYNGGMLYLKSKTPFTDTLTPLIPRDSLLGSTMFYIYMNGVETPVEFQIKDNGDIDLFIERYRYHKTR